MRLSVPSEERPVVGNRGATKLTECTKAVYNQEVVTGGIE
jgi:hypothetical protein